MGPVKAMHMRLTTRLECIIIARERCHRTESILLIFYLPSHVYSTFSRLLQQADELKDALVLQADLRFSARSESAIRRWPNIDRQIVGTQVWLFKLC
jgi:hypothetical protein